MLELFYDEIFFKTGFGTDPVAESIDPDWGDKVNSGPPGYIDWRAVRQPYAGVNFIPQSRIYEFIYSFSQKLVPDVKISDPQQ
jgi:hypothetical protein